MTEAHKPCRVCGVLTPYVPELPDVVYDLGPRPADALEAK